MLPPPTAIPPAHSRGEHTSLLHRAGQLLPPPPRGGRPQPERKWARRAPLSRVRPNLTWQVGGTVRAMRREKTRRPVPGHARGVIGDGVCIISDFDCFSRMDGQLEQPFIINDGLPVYVGGLLCLLELTLCKPWQRAVKLPRPPIPHRD